MLIQTGLRLHYTMGVLQLTHIAQLLYKEHLGEEFYHTMKEKFYLIS